MNESERRYHEVANLFPLMQGEEYEALKADIAANGLREAIWLHPDGSIIDGRNRHRACLELGIAPTFRTWDGNGSLVAFVVSLNLHRRHLTALQRAAIAVDILPMLEKEAKERQRLAAEQTNQRRHGFVAEMMQASPLIAEVAFSKFRESESRTPFHAAKEAERITGANASYIYDMKRWREEAPDVYEMGKAGVINGNEARQLAKLEPQARAVAIEIAKSEDKPVSKAVQEAVTLVRRQERVERINEISQGNTPLQTPTRYPVIYADPPWRYEHSKTDNRQIENHYPTMALEEICALPVSDIATPDAVLFLWATSPKLAESMQVIDAWGFVYRTCIVWDKERIGMGYYARQQHELLLIATRGNLPVPEPANRPASVVRIRRDPEHSAKPREFYEIIERMYPEYSRIELFARNAQPGWAVWGNQV